MPLCSLEQFLAEQLSGSTFKVLLDVMFLYSRNALKVAFLDGGSWFFFTSHKSASLGKKPKINKDYSIYRFLFPAIAKLWGPLGKYWGKTWAQLHMRITGDQSNKDHWETVD